MEWIKVTDKLPEEEGCYLTVDGKDVQTSWFDTKFKHWFQICSRTKPTHWMPLPEPPQESLLGKKFMMADLKTIFEITKEELIYSSNVLTTEWEVHYGKENARFDEKYVRSRLESGDWKLID